MFESKFTDLILDHLPKKYWNSFSRFLAFFSLRTIGTPIRFSCRGFTLQEYCLAEASVDVVESFLQFCYPPDMPERLREINIDKRYWPQATTFVVWRDSDGSVVGCIQFIKKSAEKSLPMEFSEVVSEGRMAAPAGGIASPPRGGRSAEIYRCRRSMDLSGGDAAIVLTMLFKAVWATVICTSTDFSVLTCNFRDKRLLNLYTRKLGFTDTGVRVTYGGSPAKWGVLCTYWTTQEQDTAARSKHHFELVTFCRRGLKNQRLRTRAVENVQDHLFTEDDTLLFANVTTAANLRRKGLRKKSSSPAQPESAVTNAVLP